MRQSSPLTPPRSTSPSPDRQSNSPQLPPSPASPMHSQSNQHASGSGPASVWSSAGSSPTDSHDGFDGDEDFAFDSKWNEDDSRGQGHARMHTPPLSPRLDASTSLNKSTIPALPSKSSHPYPRPPTSQQNNHSAVPSRPARPRGLAPLTTLPSPPQALGAHGHLPKSQPLSRALFARIASDTPHAGQIGGSKKKAGSQKVIVPTKGFRTTFELGLSASELARKA